MFVYLIPNRIVHTHITIRCYNLMYVKGEDAKIDKEYYLLFYLVFNVSPQLP